MPRPTLMFSLSVALGSVLILSIIGLLLVWWDPYAVLFALLGATLGWCAGMLLAPFQHEKEIFAGFSTTVAGFLSGYLVREIGTSK